MEEGRIKLCSIKVKIVAQDYAFVCVIDLVYTNMMRGIGYFKSGEPVVSVTFD